MIKINNLIKYYPLPKGYLELIICPFREKKITALDGINLNIEAGEVFFLLGPNGAGKTTLIKILATLLLPDKGSVFIKDINVASYPEKAKKLIGYAINDERSFYLRLTGRQNLEFYASLNDIPEHQINKKIKEVLELTNLSQLADNRINTYSTGMRQMLSIARALLSDPELILVDEPTKSLDPHAAKKIREFIQEELAEKRKHTIIWSSHDLNEAEKYGKSFVLLEKGKIKLNGNISETTKNGSISLESVYNKEVKD